MSGNYLRPGASAKRYHQAEQDRQRCLHFKQPRKQRASLPCIEATPAGRLHLIPISSVAHAAILRNPFRELACIERDVDRSIRSWATNRADNARQRSAISSRSPSHVLRFGDLAASAVGAECPTQNRSLNARKGRYVATRVPYYFGARFMRNNPLFCSYDYAWRYPDQLIDASSGSGRA